MVNTVEYMQKLSCYGEKLICKKYTTDLFNGSYNLYRKTLLGHYGCVNSVSFSNNGDLFISGGDDKRVLLWKTSSLTELEKPQPSVMKTEHMCNIFSTIFDCTSKFIFSAGMDEQVIRHDIERRDAVSNLYFEEPIYAVDSPFDNSFIFAASGEDGTVQVVDTRSSSDRLKLASSRGSYHSAVFSPIESQLLATANSREGIALWDIRRPLRVLKDFSQKHKNNSAMSVRFDFLSRRLLGLLRKGGPVLYDIESEKPLLYSFRQNGRYSNVCTMKTACFVGEKQEFVASGSDDFNIYVWKIPEDQSSEEVENAHFVLRGHRSIVNQVRYDRHQQLLASSGVEKCIKIWSCFPLKGCEGDLTNEEDFTMRKRYTDVQYRRLTLEVGTMSHDYDDGSVHEDPRMLALFDSLIERTQNDWASDSDSEDDEGSESEVGPANDDSRVRAILNILFNSEDSESSDSDNEHINEQRHIDTHIFELRRIFRSTRRINSNNDGSLVEGNSSTTMVNLDHNTTYTNNHVQECTTVPTNIINSFNTISVNPPIETSLLESGGLNSEVSLNPTPPKSSAADYNTIEAKSHSILSNHFLPTTLSTSASSNNYRVSASSQDLSHKSPDDLIIETQQVITSSNDSEKTKSNIDCRKHLICSSLSRKDDNSSNDFNDSHCKIIENNCEKSPINDRKELEMCSKSDLKSDSLNMAPSTSTVQDDEVKLTGETDHVENSTEKRSSSGYSFKKLSEASKHRNYRR